jgi:hypothetical protein
MVQVYLRTWIFPRPSETLVCLCVHVCMDVCVRKPKKFYQNNTCNNIGFGLIIYEWMSMIENIIFQIFQSLTLNCVGPSTYSSGKKLRSFHACTYVCRYMHAWMSWYQNSSQCSSFILPLRAVHRYQQRRSSISKRLVNEYLQFKQEPKEHLKFLLKQENLLEKNDWVRNYLKKYTGMSQQESLWHFICKLEPVWPDALVKKSTQNVAQPIFFETNTHVHHFYHRKIAKNLGYIYIYLKQLPKVNNRPIGDSSPNLVTLVGTLKLVVASQGQFFQKKIRFVKPQMSNVCTCNWKSKRSICSSSFFISTYQGDQIGRSFANWVIVYFEQFFYYRSSPSISMYYLFP